MKILRIAILFCVSMNICFAQDLDPKVWPNLRGYWKFQDAKSLTKATIGNNLILVGTHQQVAGAAYGDTAIRIAVGSYYKYAHNIAPNGGGDSVNQYTLMFDFKVLNFNRWHTFFQTDTTNANDGECFIRPNTGSNPGRIGTATTGYTPDSINPNQWYRLVIAVNLNHFYRYYLNGKLILEGDTQEVDGRFALLPQILFFADNNQEDDTIDIASLAIFDTCLSTTDAARLGSIEPCVANPPKIFLGQDTSLCEGNSLNLNAGTNYIKYQWSTGNKSPFESINVNKLGFGKKAVWVQVTGRNGCTGSDSILIEFLPLPETRIVTSCAPPPYRGCIIVRNRLKYNDHATIWKGLPNGNTLSTADSFIICSSGKYMLMVTSPFGCENTDTIDLVLSNISAKPLVTKVGNNAFCKGDSVKLQGPAGFLAYQWSNGDTLQNILVSHSDSLSLVVKDTYGCESPPSDTTIVVVFDLPVAPLIQVNGSTTFCDVDSLVLTAIAGYKKYIWQDSTFENAERTIRNSGNYSVVLQDSNNCLSPASKSVFVDVLPGPPKPLISAAGKTVICEGETVKLSLQGAYPGYSWSDSGTTKDVIASKAGNYNARVFGTNGCPSPWSENISIIVNSVPSQPSVSLGTNDSLKSNRVADQYRWYLDGLVLGDTTNTIYAIHSGYFQVQVAEKDCWSSRSDSLFYKNAGIQTDNRKYSQLIFIPNPVDKFVSFRMENNASTKEVGIIISDIRGKKVWEEIRYEEDLIKGVDLNLETLVPGIYLVTVVNEDFSYSGRLVKQ